MDPRLDEIIRFLNDQRVRATYGAVADVLGVIPISMGARLGDPFPEASWIVSAKSGLPTGYSPEQRHPSLLQQRSVIRQGSQLRERLEAWRAAR